MFRILALGLLVILPLHAHAAEIVRGKVTSVQRCYPSGYSITLGGVATTTVITSTAAIPAVNTSVIALVGATTTCDIDSGSATTLVTGKALSFILSSSPAPTPLPPSSLPSTSNNPGSTNAGSNPIQGALDSFLNTAGGAVGNAASNALSNALGTTVTGAATQAAGAVAGGLIYGGTYNVSIPCLGGVFYIPDFVGIPYSGPVTWFAPAPQYLVNVAAPPSPTQCHIGRLVGAAVCCISAHICFPPAPRIQFYGSSAPGCLLGMAQPGIPPSTPSQTPPSNNQTACGLSEATPSSKLASEKAVRDSLLSQCGVQVNKSACAFGASFRSTPGGCTDVGALSCGATSYACDLASKCGANNVVITGGNEAGHLGFGSNVAIDVRRSAGLETCLNDPTKFTKTARGYVDNVTGATFLAEDGGTVFNQTAPNFHVCTAGGRCSH